MPDRFVDVRDPTADELEPVAETIRDLRVYGVGDPPPPVILLLLGREIHETARSKGFYKTEFLRTPTGLPAFNTSLPAEKLALIHEEVSETLKALRDDDREKEAEEVADIVIRVLDYAAWRGIDLDIEVEKKMAKNRTRPHLHGRKF